MEVKCKMSGCPKGYTKCCFFCEEKKSCDCDCTDDYSKCEDAIIEADALQLFTEKSKLIMVQIAEFTKQKAAIEIEEKKLREALVIGMEENGFKQLQNENVKITYIAPTVRNSIDSTKLKAKYPDIAAECNKVSNVKASVKIEAK